jgi:hypothetical protein
MGWEEKRQYKRAYFRLAVEIRSETSWQYVEAGDVSAGGMFVVTDKVEPPNTKIEVMFDFGKEGKKKLVCAEAIVMWSRAKPGVDEEGNVVPAGMGIKFVKFLPAGSQSDIDTIIKENGDKDA